MRKIAAFSFVLFALIAIPMGMRGQTRTEVVAYTLDGTITGSGSNYATENSITQNGISWKVTGNTTMNPWRIGGKSISNVDRPVYSTNYISDNITKIEVTHGTASGITVNSWTVIVATDASFTNVVSTLTPTFTASATTTINRPTGADWTNCYYKFIYNVTVTQTSNKFVQFEKADFYKQEGSGTVIATPTYTPAAGAYTTTQNVTISCETQGSTIYYTTDGSTPNNNSTQYNGAVTVSETTTINAIAYVDNDASSVASATYTIVNLEHAGTLADPYTVADAYTAIDANAGTQSVYATGIVSAIPTEWSTQYNNITFNFVDDEGDNNFLQAFRCVGGTDVDASMVAVGDIVVVYGNLIKYGQTYEFASGCQLVSLTHPVVTTPSVTVTPATITAPFAGAEGTLALAYENIEEFISFDYYFCDAEGNELQEDPDWIYAEIQEENDTYSLYYLIDANNGEARTAYLKVYTFDENLEEVYAIVTVNQAQYVIDYAELPFEWLSFDETPTGITNNGVSTGSNNTYLKFDGSEDNIILKFNERPGTLEFNVKGNPGSNGWAGTFKVQTSVNGVSYTDLATYDDLSTTEYQEASFANLDENVRYIKWVYTEKVSGNVAVNYISLAEYEAPVPAITVESTTITATAEETVGTLNVTYTAIATDLGASIYWYTDNTGTTTTDEPNWISANINETTLNVDYMIAGNNDEARTAYFKVYALDDEGNDVYSDLVIVSQAAVPQDYDLTVEPFENLELITFVNDEMVMEEDGTISVTSGAQVMLSIVADEGYVIETLMVNGEDHASDIAADFTYTFEMPAGNVTISATAVEVPEPTGDQYELFSGDLVEGDYIIYYNGYALKNEQLGTTGRLSYEMVNPDNNMITTDDVTIVWHIAPSATEDYWTIYSDDAQAYAASTGAKNKAQMLADGTDGKALWSVTTDEGTYEFANKANVEAGFNHLLRNNGTNGFACYAAATGGALSLYKKVEAEGSEYHISYVTNNGTEIEETVAVGGTSVSLPSVSVASDSEWSFEGWSTSYVCETQTTPATMVTSPYVLIGDVVLYAVYMNNTIYSSHPTATDCRIIINAEHPSETEDFEGYTTSTTYWTEAKPSCWSLVWIEQPRRPSRRSQVVYEPVYARGDYYLRMDSLNIYAMPPIYADENTYADISTLQMGLYVRQPYASHQLQVGVLEESSVGTVVFVPVSTINNLTSALEYRTVDFSGYSGDGHRIAFKNVYSDGDHGLKSFNYIDDITISRIADNTCGITELPYTNDFDELTSETGGRTGVSLECWTLAQKDYNFADTYAPQLYYGTAYAHSGAYTLLLDGRCIYAMPEFKVEGKSIGDVELEFNVRQSSASCSLQVGVMSDLNDASTFVVLDTISNNGFSGQQKHVVDFGQNASRIPEGAKFIAFRNIYDGTWGRSPQYLDDIKLAERMDCGITELPYVQNFDSLTNITKERTGVQPECWTEVMRDANYAATYDPQLVHAAYYAHSGEYTLMLDGRCIYAMPEFKVGGKAIADVQMEFYVRQYSSNCLLEVGVMSDLNGSFVTLETISNGGASGQQMHVVDFSQHANSIPEGAKYIAFRNIYNGTWGRSINYIDDITLTSGEAESKISETSDANVIEEIGVERYLEGIAVYPNPTVGELHIGAVDVQKVECYNLMGKLVAVYNNENDINISSLANGVYTLRITLPQGVTMRKVVKR